MTRTSDTLLVAALITAAAAALSAQFGRPSARMVSFRAQDGRTVTAFHLEAGERPAAAVVLVPMLGRPKEDWQPIADALVEAGLTAVAVDLPGHVPPADPNDLAGWHVVIGAAIDYLTSRPEVRTSAIGVAGASLGANLAVVAAAMDPRIRSLALVSPSLDYRGVRVDVPLRQYGARPALLLASRRDPYAARSVRELAAAGQGLRELHWGDEPAHGTVLLAREPELARTLVEWFQRTLG